MVFIVTDLVQPRAMHHVGNADILVPLQPKDHFTIPKKPMKPAHIYTDTTDDQPWVPRAKLTLSDLPGSLPIFNGSLVLNAPFSHQVAGHDPLLKAENGLVCKPAIARELWFYMNLYSHPRYIPFVPTFLGCVDIDYSSIQTLLENSFDSLTSVLNNDNDGLYITPWGKRMQHEQLQEISSVTTKSKKFMVMKDITYSFNKPSVIDIKLGTRAYGDDASEKKKRSQHWKCSVTTSATIGVRICGSQVYKPQREEYDFMHKYEGRNLTSDTLPAALLRFFHNGVSLRTDLIRAFLVRLRQLEKVLEEDPAFRLYSSSLLLVYEGEKLDSQKIEVKMIDFAHTYEVLPEVLNDDGYLLGLRNLMSVLSTAIEGDEEERGI